MSLQGVLRDFAAADVLQLIAQQRMTGVLDVENETVTLVITVKDGQVVRARPGEARRDDALASMLVRAGAMSAAELAEVRSVQEDTLDPLAQVLKAQGCLDKDELGAIARLLSEDTIFQLFQCEDGRFAFRPEPVTEELGDLAVGGEMFLLDGLRMSDEWPQIRTVLPTLALVLTQSAGVEVYEEKRPGIAIETGISEEGLDLLFHRCDGETTARKAIDLSRLGTFPGALGLAAMLKANLVEIVERRRRKRRGDDSKGAARRGATPLPWRQLAVVAGVVAGVVSGLLAAGWLFR